MAKQARIVLPIAGDMVAADQQRIAINKARRDAISRGDPAGYNNQLPPFNAQVDRWNAAHNQLRAVLGT